MTLRAPRRIAAVLAVPALLAGGVAAAAPGAEAATSEPTYKGSSMALSVKVNLAGSSLLDEVLPGLVTYPPGAKTSLLELPEELSELVTLKVLNASSGVNNGVLESNAHTASLGVLGEVITARVLNADCTSNQGDSSGDSQVAGLTLAGTKVPVDPGPNFKIEIPDALAALVQGSIVIDEQVPIGDGGIQVRALHINLVVAPTAIEDALNSVIATVRETAEQLKVVVEEATGKTLEQLVGVAEAEKAQKVAKQKSAQTSKKGAQNADKPEVRASAAAPAAPAAAAAPAEAAAPAAPAAGTEKADGADVEAEALAEEQAEEQAEVESTEEAESAEEAAAAERAERAAQGAKADQDVPAEESGSTELSGDIDASETAASTEPAVVAEEVQPAAAAPAPVPAPAKAKEKASDLPLLDKVQAAIPAADSIAGALGLDIIVSQVTCEGAPGEVKGANRPEQLPSTGGNGDAARNVAVAGLGLLLVGGTAVGLTRRRRSIV